MKDKLRELLENMDDISLIMAWNEYQCHINGGDDEIFPMDWFDEMMQGKDPWEIARCCYYGTFCPAHDYFWFNGYGNLESSNFPMDNICIDDMIDYIIEHDEDLSNDEIREILDGDDND